MELSALAIRVARTPGLGMLPQVTSQVLKLVDNPNASPRQIGALIERDAGLASKLLKTANSAYYGTPGKIKTVSQAISVMGLSAVRSVVVGQAYQQMTAVRGASKRFDRLAFWQHGLATATAARVLAKLKGWRDPEEAFLAGLLHDAGRLVMDRFLSNEFDQILTLALERVSPLIEVEREVLGYTHVEVCDLLAKEWNLPETMREPLRRHHDDVRFDECPLGCIVHAANVLAHQAGFALGAPVLYEIPPQVHQSLGIPDAQYEGLKQAIVHEVVKVQEALRI
ncbi:MAG: HDOD domain-containing protein [bacterium]|nr:HDOD domain-containing protein [bacterium]